MRIERARAVAAAVRAAVPLGPGLRALEYGCGTGLLSFALQGELGEILLADTSDGMLAVLRQKIAAARLAHLHPLNLDLAVEPPPALQLDLIYTLMTMHHIPDTAAVLRGFAALLAPGGRLCIADLEAEDGSFHEPGFEGHNGFEPAALEAQLRQAGFSEIHFERVFNTPKERAGVVRYYPLFLACARR